MIYKEKPKFYGGLHLSDLDVRKILILWDVDGTLVEVGRGRDDKHRRAVEILGACVIPKQTRQGGKTDVQIITELVRDNNLNLEIIPEALKLLDQLTIVELGQQPLQAAENALSALSEFSKRGWINGLLTGNTHARAKMKLESAGLLEEISEKFSFDGQEAPDRLHLSWGASKTLLQSGMGSVVIVGDTPLDIEAARFAGFTCVAVATGSFDMDELAKCDPDLLIQDLLIGFNSLTSFKETRFRF